MTAELIGISLSSCIASILEDDDIPPERVRCILGRTICSIPEDWEAVLGYCKQQAWRADPDRGERICRDLLSRGQILQPRLTHGVRPISLGDYKAHADALSLAHPSRYWWTTIPRRIKWVDDRLQRMTDFDPSDLLPS